MRTFQNLLVTGGAGFIGSNFIRHVLTKTDFKGRIVNFDALTYAGNPHSLDDIAAKHPESKVFLMPILPYQMTTNPQGAIRRANNEAVNAIIVGFVDIYGNSTASKKQLEKMNAWSQQR